VVSYLNGVATITIFARYRAVRLWKALGVTISGGEESDR